MDMRSGGGAKLKPFEYIYIEAPEKEARIIFYRRFHRNPDRVTCTCCGPDYSVTESENLEQATAYERGCEHGYFRPDGNECPQDEAWLSGKGLVEGYRAGWIERPSGDRWKKYLTLADYQKRNDVLFIPENEIQSDEREGEVPEEGYIWR